MQTMSISTYISHSNLMGEVKLFNHVPKLVDEFDKMLKNFLALHLWASAGSVVDALPSGAFI